MICLVVITLIGAMGVGFAAWLDGVDIKGIVATGDIDPVFTSCEVTGETISPGIAEAVPEDEGKKLHIYIDGAYPGYYASFRYQISNLGTVPVSYETQVCGNNPALELQLDAPGGIIQGHGDSQEGTLRLTVVNVQENMDYDFTVDLVFRQCYAVN